MSVYSYGAFQLNNTAGGYYLMSKELSFATYKPSIQPIARADLWKITSYQVDSRTIQVGMRIVGTSRVDVMNKKDTLEASLALRDQPLCLHEDGRTWTANAVSGPCKFSAGTGIVYGDMTISFVCVDTFAKATSTTTYDSGNVQYVDNSPGGNKWASGVISITNTSGTAYSYPQVRLVNRTPAQNVNLTSPLTGGSTYTSLAVTTGLPALNSGQVMQLVYNTGTPLFNEYVQKVTLSANTAANATTLPVTSFTAANNFPSPDTTVYVSAAWNSVSIWQITDNYTIGAASANTTVMTFISGVWSAAMLPQFYSEPVDFYCDPEGAQGMAVYSTLNGTPVLLQPTGPFPVVEPGSTNWKITISSDTPMPTVDFSVIYTPRFQS